jgi:CAAX prenyl protease-like protein
VFDQTLRAIPAGAAGAGLAIIFSAAVFSGVHFIRRARTRWPAVGLFAFGCLAAAAYLAGGKTYWLPVGLHAGGIFATQILRPFVEYRGPVWLVGNRDNPLAGAIGIFIMILLGAYVVVRFSAGLGP